MSRVGPYNESTIPIEPYDNVLNYEYTSLYKSRKLKARLLSQFKEQSNVLENIFDEWFIKANQQLVEHILAFVNQSIEPQYFVSHDDQTVMHVTTAVLGHEVSDHGPILDYLERELVTKRSDVTRFRLKKDDCSKKLHELFDIFRQLVKESLEKLLVIVENTESIDIDSLSNLFEEIHLGVDAGKCKLIMVLFCSSTNVRPVRKLISQGSQRLVKFFPTIKKAADRRYIQDLQIALFTNPEVKYKLDLSLTILLFELFSERDPSLLNLKYLFKLAFFLHCRKIVTVLTFDEKTLAKSKYHNIIIDALRSTESLSATKDKIDWINSKKSLLLLRQSIVSLSEYILFLDTQTKYLYELLKDQTGNAFPDSPKSIYDSILASHIPDSPNLQDTLASCHKWDPSTIGKRVQSAIEKIGRLSTPAKHRRDVYDIFKNYLDKIENNPGLLAKLTSSFIDDLIDHSKTLVNPTKWACSEAVYFSDKDLFKQRCGSSRHALLPDLLNDTDFGRIYKTIHEGENTINLADVFFHFDLSKEFVDETKTKKKKTSRKSVKEEEKTKLDKSLLLSIFKKSLEDMVYMGLIDINTRKRPTIRKILWL